MIIPIATGITIVANAVMMFWYGTVMVLSTQLREYIHAFSGIIPIPITVENVVMHTLKIRRMKMFVQETFCIKWHHPDSNHSGKRRHTYTENKKNEKVCPGDTYIHALSGIIQIPITMENVVIHTLKIRRMKIFVQETLISMHLVASSRFQLQWKTSSCIH